MRARPWIPNRSLAIALASLLVSSALAAAREPPTTVAKAPISLPELSRSFQDLAEKVGPAVVQMHVTGFGGQPGDGFGHQRSTGSGVIVEPDGWLLTNAHVVEGARQVRVVLASPRKDAGPGRSILPPRGESLPARLVGLDRESDLAVLKVEAAGLPALSFGDSDELRQGELVFAFGGPLGLANSMSMGIVSSVARQVVPDDSMVYVQTDAPINPGNSGGPLVDVAGRMVGLSTFILSQSGGNEGLGFAVPSNIVRNVYRQLRRDGRVRRGTIGVAAQTITPELARGLSLGRDWGVVVGDVEPGGAAAVAGVRVGDIVLTLDGKPMENARQLDVNLYRHGERDVVRVELLRGSKTLSLTLDVALKPDDSQRFADLVDPDRDLVSELGVVGASLQGKLAQSLAPLRIDDGVAVAWPLGWGAGRSLAAGDVIHVVNGVHVADLDGLRATLAKLDAHAPIVLQIERKGELRFVVVERE